MNGWTLLVIACAAMLGILIAGLAMRAGIPLPGRLGICVIMALLLAGISLGDVKSRDLPACQAEDGGPDLPCQWDGGVTENGLRMVIVYDRAE